MAHNEAHFVPVSGGTIVACMAYARVVFQKQ